MFESSGVRSSGAAALSNRSSPMKPWLATALIALSATPQAPPEYSIKAIRYATVPQFPLSVLVADAPPDERVDIAMVIWVIRGDGRSILLDAGFHREGWLTRFNVTDYIRPDSAVRLAGVDPREITDVIISHAHWDHMGGIDLFPNATIWIQEAEYVYYSSAAWQEGGLNGGIDRDDVLNLVRFNTEGRVRLIAGDDVELLPGIRAYTGARHTFASQYLSVAGDPTFVLASDNCYMYLNIELRSPVATFTPADRQASLAALTRMLTIAGAPERVVPGHDPLQFERFPTQGRVATIK